MGSPKKSTQTKTIKTVGQYFNKKIAAFLIVVTAVIGAYFMFFASAAVNNCSLVTGGKVCDINQAQSDQDATWSVGPGVQNLITNSGWKDLGVPFRAPTFAYNGAVPVTRFYRKDITGHNLVRQTDPLYKTYKADPTHYLDEGVLFYAWPDGREPGTVPIYSADRKALWFYKVFTDNKNVHNQYLNAADKSWQDGGILFWAYPSNWYPPINSAPTAKNSGCPNANLKQGDRGACVQTLKTILNSYGATPKIDANNDLFDDLTHRNVIYYLGKLQGRGVKVENYTTTVTLAIWQAFSNGYPPTPATTKAPAKAAVVPVKTNAKPPANSKPAPKTDAKPDPKKATVPDCSKAEGQKTKYCQDFFKAWQKALDGAAKKKAADAQWNSAVTAAAQAQNDANIAFAQKLAAASQAAAAAAAKAASLKAGHKSTPSQPAYQSYLSKCDYTWKEGRANKYMSVNASTNPKIPVGIQANTKCIVLLDARLRSDNRFMVRGNPKRWITRTGYYLENMRAKAVYKTGKI